MVRLVTSYSSSKIFWLVQWNMTNKCCSSSTSPIDLSEAVEFADAEIQCHGTTGSPFRTEKEGARWERYINLSQELQLNCSICQELWLNLTASWGLSRVLVGKFFFGRSFGCKKLQLLLPTVDLPASFSWKIDETVKADFAGSSTVALLQEQPTNNKQQPTKNKKQKKQKIQPATNKQQTTNNRSSSNNNNNKKKKKKKKNKSKSKSKKKQPPTTKNHQPPSNKTMINSSLHWHSLTGKELHCGHPWDVGDVFSRGVLFILYLGVYRCQVHGSQWRKKR